MKEMYELIARLYAVQILADDLHYRSKGKEFYTLHLLADRVKDGLDEDIDSLRETFFMGEMKITPPSTIDSMSQAADIARGLIANTEGSDENLSLIFRLREIVDSVVHVIESIKRMKSEMFSGTAAVLDGISQKMMVSYALLDRTSM